MSQTIAPRFRALTLLLLAVAGVLLAGAAPASAHAALTGSDPQQGVVVDKAPSQVSLTFSEQVAMSDDSLRVLDPKGNRVDTGKPANVSGTTYAVRLHSGLPDGTYTVAYQVVSADSHPVGGAYTFSIGAPSKTSATVGDQTVGGGIVGALYGVGRYVSYAGFIVLAGGAAFVLACWQRGSGVRAVQRLVVSGWVALTAATLALLLLRGSYTTSGKIGDVFDLTLLGQVLQTKSGAALVSRLLLLAAAALFVAVLFGEYQKRADDEKRDLTFGLAIGGTVVAVGLAASWAMAEHASTGLQPGIAMPVDVVHLLAVAAWLGGLAALLVTLYRAPAETPIEPAAVRRFSRLAFGSVLALVATGTYQSWRQVGSWSALTDTRYGQLLLIKIALVLLMVGIAATSRRWTGLLAETATTKASAKARAKVAAAAGRKSGSDATTGAGADSKTGSGKGGAGKAAGKAEAGKAGAGKAAAGGKDAAKGKTGGKAQPGGKAAKGEAARRAAQLARQQAAVDTARQKRLRDADPHRFGLRRSVLMEAGVAVVLLVVTTVLTQTEPGRTETEAKAATSSSSSSSSSSAAGAVTLDMPFDTGGKDGKGVVRIDIDPARVGGNELHIFALGTDGRLRDVAELKISFTLATKNIGPLPVTPEHVTTGHWVASGVQIPMAGDWKVEATVRTSDIDQVSVTKNAQIG
ncbi:copper resistance CopC/CopD family protein [Streptomyces sp. NPDC088337]|uniref:copper resistance CopC/CopD family protein n=1 Tax=unclassified Streptomyces TaxID=2593676 RepID=UPI002DDC10F9|nr:copper resistance protein CopC [Streptomyces sp. NBC_01788]WSB27620.1 copper resistance protein CopC [Streptomyces sp. NBC_01788]